MKPETDNEEFFYPEIKFIKSKIPDSEVDIAVIVFGYLTGYEIQTKKSVTMEELIIDACENGMIHSFIGDLTPSQLKKLIELREEFLNLTKEP